MSFTISKRFCAKVDFDLEKTNKRKKTNFELREKKSGVQSFNIAKNPRSYYSAFFLLQFKNGFGNKFPKRFWKKIKRAEFFLCPHIGWIWENE
jgi:hypothetical protein